LKKFGAMKTKGIVFLEALQSLVNDKYEEVAMRLREVLTTAGIARVAKGRPSQ